MPGLRLLAFVLAALALPGCGLQPLYGNSAGSVARGELRAIALTPIDGKAGWLVRNALTDRIGDASSGGARYRLDIVLDDRITGFGLRRDDAVTRERRALRARYKLYDAGSGALLVDATAGSDAGIDVATSEYATVAAEESALERLSGIVADQIVTRLALHFREASHAGAPK